MKDQIKSSHVTSARSFFSKKQSSKYNFDDEPFLDNAYAVAKEVNDSDAGIYKNRLNNFLDIVITIGNDLTDTDDPSEALANILKYAQNITNADAGTIYRKTKVNQLDFMIISNRSLNLFYVQPEECDDFYCQPVKLYDPKTGQANMSSIASVTYHSNQMIIVNDAYLDDQYDFTGTKAFDKKNNYRSKSFLTIPLRNKLNQVIGVFQLINAVDNKSDQIIPFKQEHLKMIEALASLAAICLRK